MNFANSMAQNGEPCCHHIKMIDENSQYIEWETAGSEKMQSYLIFFVALTAVGGEMPCWKWLFSEIDSQRIHSGGNIGNENTGAVDLTCLWHLPDR
jgi:hypothetical protein